MFVCGEEDEAVALFDDDGSDVEVGDEEEERLCCFIDKGSNF